MSDEPSFNHSCTGKVAFPDKVKAMAVLKRRLRQHKVRFDGRGRVEPYRCQHCGQWHLGAVAMR